MPLIEFQCKEHGLFTRILKADQEYQAVCPKCQKSAIRKFSAPFKERIGFRDGWDVQAGKYFSTQAERDSWASKNSISIYKD